MILTDAIYGRRKKSGNVNEAFIISVKTDNVGTSGTNQFTIPVYNLFGGFYTNYNIKTSDGQNIQNVTSSSYTITFPTPGIYDIEITGDFPAIFMNQTGDRQKVLEVKNWGSIVWKTFYNAFKGCVNLQVTATDTPNLTNCSSFYNMFSSCSAFTGGDFSSWNTSNITSMEATFLFCPNFDGDVSTWNTSNVTTMLNMFRRTKFSGDISNWNVSKVTDMRWFCDETSTFISDISNWNPTALTQASPFIRMPVDYLHLDAIYNNWSQKTLKTGVTINFGQAKYTSAGQAGRDILTNTYGWTITDGGLI